MRLANLTPRTHPPTFAAAASAVVASLASDVEPYVADLPVISETTASLTLLLGVAVVGGLIGRLAERYTVPYLPPPAGDGPDEGSA